MMVVGTVSVMGVDPLGDDSSLLGSVSQPRVDCQWTTRCKFNPREVGTGHPGV